MKLEEAITLLADRPQATGLFCDFDGTLSPTVDRPDDARAIDGAPDVLARLARSFAVVGVISGRSLSDLQSRLAAPGVVLAGSYGLERSDRPASLDVSDLQPVATRAVGATRDWAGVVVERKQAGVAVHYRLAPDRADDVHRLASDLAREFSLQVRQGRMVAELTVPGPGKDDALATLVSEHNLDTFLFAGDDVADGDAFVWARSSGRRCVLVGVRSAEMPDVIERNADVVLEGPEALVGMLGQLLARGA